MINAMSYNKAYVEILKIIEMLPDCEYKKIPKKLIKSFEENRDNQYQFDIKSEEDFQHKNLLQETKYILYALYRNYLADCNEKEQFKKMEGVANHILEENKKLKYNPNNLFKNKK